MFLVPGRGHDVLVGLINSNNTFPVPLTASSVRFSSPKTASDIPNGVKVAVYPVLDGVYSGSAEIKYQRMDLTAAFGTIRPEIKGLGSGTLHTMLPIFNQALGTGFTTDDIEDVVMDWVAAGSEVNITFKAKLTSLSYSGEFQVKFTRLRPTLTDTLKTATLNVHRYLVDPAVNKRSVAMALYGIDFSQEVKDKILQTTTTAGYSWSNPAAVSTLFSELGFDAWPAVVTNTAPLVDKATKDVPEANQSFERVIIQRNVEGANYSGTAYLHYNRS